MRPLPEIVKETLDALSAVHGQVVYRAFAGDADPFEVEPKSIEGSDAWYEWCDDCETFHCCYYVFGYEVTEGSVEIVIWCCDQDGNWDVVESATVGTPEAEGLDVIYGGEGWQKGYVAYLRHVAETGEDPCGEFFPPSPNVVQERWRIHVFERGQKVWVTRGERLGEDGVVKESWEQSDKLPEYVQEYLLLEKVGDVSANAIDPENVRRVEDIPVERGWVPGGHRGQLSAEVDIEHRTPSMTDEEWSAKLKEKANAARALLAFRD